jgi:hypothetical protein
VVELGPALLGLLTRVVPLLTCCLVPGKSSQASSSSPMHYHSRVQVVLSFVNVCTCTLPTLIYNLLQKSRLGRVHWNSYDSRLLWHFLKKQLSGSAWVGIEPDNHHTVQ